MTPPIKTEKKLNTLTIIQSIIVPLILVAGIYGMNFIVMPELKWTSRYYIILGFSPGSNC